MAIIQLLLACLRDEGTGEIDKAAEEQQYYQTMLANLTKIKEQVNVSKTSPSLLGQDRRASSC